MSRQSPSAIDREYQAEDDHRTLSRAQEISEDKHRMAGVRKHHRKMSRSLSKLSPLMRAGMGMSKGGR